MNHRGQGRKGSPGDHRCTPEEIWRLALKAAGLYQEPAKGDFWEFCGLWDLDPATNEFSEVPARRRLTGPEGSGDGLAAPWSGCSVWVNPPFSQMLPWAQKAIQEAPRAKSLTFLGPDDSSTEWHQLLTRACDAWATPPKRYHFPIPGQPKGSPPGAIRLFYFGPCPVFWMDTMREAGWIAYPGHLETQRGQDAKKPAKFPQPTRLHPELCACPGCSRSF